MTANNAGPVLRAGLTEVLVTGIVTRRIRVRHTRSGCRQSRRAPPFEVEPMITDGQSSRFDEPATLAEPVLWAVTIKKVRRQFAAQNAVACNRRSDK
jgi:hypothetical protein